ncbi:MLO-like protein 2 [Capsicum annuum]|nr:MLO-like protein 2 [Capsicum annuum]
MAGGGGGRSLEQTPTWAVAVVCFVLVAISIVIEHIIHLIGKWLKSKNKNALFEALEKVKAELMLLGFISLLLTVGQSPISNICVSEKIGNSWHPCSKQKEEELTKDGEDISENSSEQHRRRLLMAAASGSGKVPFVSADGIHQLHIFIFALAVFHVLYCITTLALGRAKMRSWKSWENETKTAEYQFSHDPERFRFTRETSFGRRHLSFWTKNPVLLWVVCFFRQFVRSVPKVDYLTLRHGFITAHLAPQSHQKFDFRKYIKRSLEEDFKVVVGIRTNVTSISNSANLLKGFGKAIIILPKGTKLIINNAIFSPTSRRNLMSFKDIRKNSYHIKIFDEMNLEYLGITKNVSGQTSIIEKFPALSSGLYWTKICAIEAHSIVNKKFTNSNTFVL